MISTKACATHRPVFSPHQYPANNDAEIAATVENEDACLAEEGGDESPRCSRTKRLECDAGTRGPVRMQKTATAKVR